MRKQTKIAKRKKRKKAMLKMKLYKEHNSLRFYKAKRMYESTLKQYYPYTTSNF